MPRDSPLRGPGNPLDATEVVQHSDLPVLVPGLLVKGERLGERGTGGAHVLFELEREAQTGERVSSVGRSERLGSFERNA